MMLPVPFCADRKNPGHLALFLGGQDIMDRLARSKCSHSYQLTILGLKFSAITHDNRVCIGVFAAR